jgi:hypothetical protein
MKWWIYYIDNYEEFVRQKKIDLNNENEIKVNPLRPFNLRWYKQLMKNFLKNLK